MSARKPWEGGLALLPCLAVVVIVAVLSGCGGNCANPAASCTPPPTPSPSTSAPTPAPPVVIAQGNFGLPARLLAVIPLTTSATGKIDVTVDWTFATNDVDVYLARGACSFDQFVAQQCTVVTFSESTSAKPEKISAPGAAAGSYVLLIGNRGPTDESVAYQVVLTTGGGASAASDRSPAGQPTRSHDYERSTTWDRR